MTELIRWILENIVWWEGSPALGIGRVVGQTP